MVCCGRFILSLDEYIRCDEHDGNPAELLRFPSASQLFAECSRLDSGAVHLLRSECFCTGWADV